VRSRLFEWLASGEPLAGQLPTMQGKVPRWDQPLGQNREGLSARTTFSSPHPYSLPVFVVSLPQAQSVADDRIVAANGASPR